MKPLLKRDVPAGAAITVVALVLLASAVTGRDEARTPPVVAEPAAAPPPAAREERPVSASDLDLERLKRPRKEGTVQDFFASRSWAPPPPAPLPVAAVSPTPPPAPAAPPLPFKYLGHMTNAERLVVFLAKNEEVLSVTADDTLDNTYRVESVSESAAIFTYLPLNQRQTLPFPAPQ